MKVALDGRRVGRGNRGCYFENKAYFSKRGLGKRTVLHELYHHSVDTKIWYLPSRREEKDANHYAEELLKAL